MDIKLFRVALVGCGTISENHLRAIELCDNVSVVALCDVIYERAERCKISFAPEATVYTDYEEMLAKEKLDAIHIATPHYLHADMTISALKRGINVFLEKPMCITESEIDRMIEAERNSTAGVCVCFQNRFTSATAMAMRVAEADGGVIGANACLFWNRDEKYYGESDWRGKIATEGGGVLINQAIHTLDLLTVFMGKPHSLFAKVSNHHLKGKIEVEDTAEAMIRFESGARASFYATTASVRGDFTNITLFTANHTIEMKLPRLFIDGTEMKFEDELNPVGKKCYGNGHYSLISRFYNALENGGKMPVTLSEAQYAVKMLFAAYKSNDLETII